MGWFKGFSKKQPAAKGSQGQKNAPRLQLQTFILEPILTPSGIIDTDDHSHDLVLDVDTPILPEIDLADNDLPDAEDTNDVATSLGSDLIEDGNDVTDIGDTHIVDDSILDEDLEEISFFDPTDTTDSASVDDGDVVTTQNIDQVDNLDIADVGEVGTQINDDIDTVDNDSIEVAIADSTSEDTATDTDIDSPDIVADHSNTDIDSPEIIADNSDSDIAADNTDELDPISDNLDITEIPETIDPSLTFTSGVFTVGETGQVEVDFLFDGGGYKGEVAIFSLRDMESLTPGSTEFIKEAATRALSDSEFGHVVISDITEAARFSGNLPGEGNQNSGVYEGVKTFRMNAGDEFGVMLVPNGTLQQLFNNPNAGGALRPLFSLVTANPNDHFHIGQIADVTGDGNTFVMEDLRVDTGSDRDYNDIIFQVRGASGKAVHLDEVIATGKDWRGSDMGQALIAYAEPYVTPDVTEDVDFGDGEIIDIISDEFDYYPEDGEYLDGDIIAEDGEYLDGDIIAEDGEYFDGDIIAEDGEYFDESDIAAEDGEYFDGDIAAEDSEYFDGDIIAEDSDIASEDSEYFDNNASASSPDVQLSDVTQSGIDTSTNVTEETSVSNVPAVETPKVVETAIAPSTNNSTTVKETVAKVPVVETAKVTESAIAPDTTTTVTEPTSVAEVAAVETPKVVENAIATDTTSPTPASNVTTAVPSTPSVNNQTVVETSPITVNDTSTTLVTEVTSTTEVETSAPITATTSATVTNSNETEIFVEQPPVKATVPKPPTSFDFPKANQPLVGVIDTGFSANNPDIDYSQITLGKDFVDGDDNPLLQSGEGSEHGTHVLGIIAAQKDNDIGIDGINDDAPVWVGRAIGSGKWAESLVEFVDAAKESAQPNAVVNLSLDLTQINPDGSVTTRYEFTPQEMAAIEYARQNNVLVVVAAGNDGGVMSALGQASQQFDNIITVGAAEQIDAETSAWKGFERAEYSSYGKGLDIVADSGTLENPVISTVGDGVGAMNGTSVATAKVTGAASQVWAANPKLSYRQVIDILKSTATDLKTDNSDLETGSGLLNMAAAIYLAKATKPEEYDPELQVVPTTWSGEGKVIPMERAVRYRYVMTANDTLWGIAQRELGSGTRWTEITKDAAGTTPFTSAEASRLPVGQIVYIPGNDPNPQPEPEPEPEPNPDQVKQAALSSFLNAFGTSQSPSWLNFLKDMFEKFYTNSNGVLNTQAPQTGTGTSSTPSPKAIATQSAKTLAGKKIILDPGHGIDNKGYDSGAVGNGTTEAVENLHQAKLVAEQLRQLGASVTILDEPLSLAQIGQRAAGYDIFVSLHQNATEAHNAQGHEVFSHPNAPAKDAELAKAINSELDAIFPNSIIPNRGTKTADFSVLRNAPTNVPAVLIESLFIDAPGMSRANVEKAATAVARGIEKFFTGSATGSTPIDDTTITPSSQSGVVNSKVGSSPLNFRAGSYVGATVIGTLSKGTPVKILKSVTGGTYTTPTGSSRKDWYQIEVNGKTGYVAAYYIDVTSSNQSSGKPGYVNSSVGLNFRTSPSATASRISLLPNGTNLTILEKVSGGAYYPDNRTDWYKVKVGNTVGYVAAYYVKEGSSNNNNNGGGGSNGNALLTRQTAQYFKNRPQFYTTGNIFAQSMYGSSLVGGRGYTEGNCTWYAHGRLLELGKRPAALKTMSGNANQWHNQMSNGSRIVSSPQVGDIAQWTANGANHVAVVEKVNADGTIVISESHWKSEYNGSTYMGYGRGTLHNIRTIRASSPTRYIRVPNA